MSRKAVRAAEHLGFPVVVKAGVRGYRAGVFVDLNTVDEVRAAVEIARPHSNSVSVESQVVGQSCKLLVVNHALLGAFASGVKVPVADVHPSITDLACRLSRELGVGMLLLDVVTTDSSRLLAETGGAVVDCDLAPQLDSLLADDAAMLDQAAEAFVRWMCPPGTTARIPVIAVTGTNGKTTTCHMIERIQRAAGRHPGVVCSDGIFVDEKYIASRTGMGAGPHHGILEVANVDVAVLEEYFGRILRVGFAFAWCDVSVCTNVTNDHLGRIGIHTLEEMAAVKFEVVRRARGTAVLNADDPFCLAMAKRANASRVCLVSSAEDPEVPGEALDNADSRCVVEPEGGRAFIVIHDGAIRIPLVAIDDIPATFAGAAAHNISNAMHAAAACYFSGVDAATIAAALRGFRMSFESTPGRLNIFDGLPFRVIMDYAHNADGFRRICTFVDRQNVAGRRIVMFSVPGDRRDADIKLAAKQMAGHFDHYVCRVYSDARRGSTEDVPRLLKSGLCEAGVAVSAISAIPDAAAAIRLALSLGAPGDLLVLLPGQIELASTWEQIRSFQYTGGKLGLE
jgi:cyanophycin synthetase